MNKRRDNDFLGDIKEAIENVIVYTKGFDFPCFMQDRKTQDAVVHNLEIIGEAAKNLSNNIRKKYPNIPWKKFAGIRDKIVHHYFGIKYDIVWQIKEELPNYLEEIKEIINKLSRKLRRKL
ncbi:MAG: DUF86 domain-containing protein [Candidatus Thermoplasmatota archaeon]